jgi:hypothetical protein
MRKSWQPTRQECELVADMLAARRPKAAIAKFLYVSESTLRRFLVRAKAARAVNIEKLIPAPLVLGELARGSKSVAGDAAALAGWFSKTETSFEHPD